MANNVWRGDSPAIAKVITLVVGSNTNGHTFVTTINGKSITITAGGSDTTSTLAAAIQAALAASEIPEFTEIEWTVDTATVTGTAKVPGVPFTVSKSGTGTYTLSTVTNSSGPNHVDDTKNWSAGTLPAATEDVIVDVPVDLLYGFENLSAEAYNSLRVKASFAGVRIGLPRWNTVGYVEYRQRFWSLATAIPVTIGEGDGEGPVAVQLTIDTAASVVVHKTGQRQTDAEPVVNLIGASSGTVSVASGDVGLASDDDTTSVTITTATVDNDGRLTVGKGATATTVEQRADAVTNGFGTVTTLNISGGTATLFAAPTTITADRKCTVDCRFTGTATTVTARGQGEGDAPLIECGSNPRAKTFTSSTFTGGAVLHDPDKSVTFTNPAQFDRLSLSLSDLGPRPVIQRT